MRSFLSLKIIVDTLTDVGNVKHQNITSLLKSILSVQTKLRDYKNVT